MFLGRVFDLEACVFTKINSLSTLWWIVIGDVCGSTRSRLPWASRCANLLS